MEFCFYLIVESTYIFQLAHRQYMNNFETLLWASALLSTLHVLSHLILTTTTYEVGIIVTPCQR